MQITSVRPVTITTSQTRQMETLHLLCSLHRKGNPEDVPDICHLILQPQHQIFRIQDTSSKSHFDPFSELAGDEESQQVHTSPSISLALMLGGVFIILFITALITCFRHRRESEVGNTVLNVEYLYNPRL